MDSRRLVSAAALTLALCGCAMLRSESHPRLAAPPAATIPAETA